MKNKYVYKPAVVKILLTKILDCCCGSGIN